eukprot:10855719-Alexandrium_andersonii.AAC.1
MSPFLPFDDRDDERRKACGRVGGPTYDALLVFGAQQVLGTVTARKNASRVLATREHIPLAECLSQVYLRVSSGCNAPADQ